MSEVFKKIIVEMGAIFFLVTGCAGTGVVVTQENNKIAMPHYSIELPANKGWKIENINKNEESLYLTKRINSTIYTMLFNINRVVDESMKSWTAPQIADNYREGEEMNMMLKGVLTGQYELRDVIKDEEIIGERKFYTMKYTTVKDDIIQNAHLFLFFPNEKKVDEFIVSLYSEAKSVKESNRTSYKREFLETLKRLIMKN